jgi:hypothetical protein
VIHFPDHVFAIHDDRQRRFEAAARDAAMASVARRNGRKPRRFTPRRAWKARRSRRSAGPVPSG